MSNIILVLCGPSGSGKSTLSKTLLDNYDIIESVSYTTRPQREDEVEGEDYFFVGKDTFEKFISDEKFIEWAKVYNQYYGTSLDFLRQCEESQQDVLLVLDTKGAANLKQQFPKTVVVSILPPSSQIQVDRLKGRGNSSLDNTVRILSYTSDLTQALKVSDYTIVNDDLDAAKEDLEVIYKASKLLTKVSHPS